MCMHVDNVKSALERGAMYSTAQCWHFYSRHLATHNLSRACMCRRACVFAINKPAKLQQTR